MFDPGGFEPRPPSSNKRQFHIEVDHDSQGVLPVAITIQMPKPPQTAHQIPSLQLRRGRKREFGTSRDSQDRGPPSLVPEMAEGGYSPLQGREKRPSLLVKLTAKTKTVQNCSAGTFSGKWDSAMERTGAYKPVTKRAMMTMVRTCIVPCTPTTKKKLPN